MKENDFLFHAKIFPSLREYRISKRKRASHVMRYSLSVSFSLSCSLCDAKDKRKTFARHEKNRHFRSFSFARHEKDRERMTETFCLSLSLCDAREYCMTESSASQRERERRKASHDMRCPLRERKRKSFSSIPKSFSCLSDMQYSLRERKRTSFSLMRKSFSFMRKSFSCLCSFSLTQSIA